MCAPSSFYYKLEKEVLLYWVESGTAVVSRRRGACRVERMGEGCAMFA
jgi:hypothetical protein